MEIMHLVNRRMLKCYLGWNSHPKVHGLFCIKQHALFCGLISLCCAFSSLLLNSEYFRQSFWDKVSFCRQFNIPGHKLDLLFSKHGSMAHQTLFLVVNKTNRVDYAK